MPLTVLTIALFSVYLLVLFQRSRSFYLHSFFLIPLYPVIFFVDHNAHFLFSELEADSVPYLIKLLPLYLNAVLLVVRFESRYTKQLTWVDIVVNIFLIYNATLSIVYSLYHSSWLPVFYVSFSVPLFAMFYNARNFRDEYLEIDEIGAGELTLFKLYFLAFCFIYAASIYYAIRSSITTSLLDSRGVGSIFASSSALVYCLVYAPLLAEMSRKRWPHLVMIAIGITSLSKTAFFMLPGYGVLLYRRFRTSFIRSAAALGAAVLVLAILAPWIVPEALVEEWKVKFALGTGETLLEKAYMTRIDLYSDAVRTMGDAPLGIGVGNFERYSHDFYRDAHNFVLTVFCESGLIVGGMFILGVLACSLRVVLDAGRGRFEFWHFSFGAIFLVYFFAGGVLQTTGNSDNSPIYYTPFYGVALMQLLSISVDSVSLRIRMPMSMRNAAVSDSVGGRA